MGYVRSYGVGAIQSGEAYDVLLPKKWRPDGTRRGVIFCHGHDGNALSCQDNQPEVRRLAARGLAVLCTDLGGARTWGNPTALTRIDQAWTWMKANLGVATDQMLLYGGSMGASAALNYTRANPANVAAVAGVKPVLDIDDIHDNDRSGLAASIETAYGNLAGWDAAKATHNPATYAAALQGVPMRFWPSTNDPICLYSIAQSFAAASGAEMVDVGATFHTFPAAGLDHDSVADFMLAHA